MLQKMGKNKVFLDQKLYTQTQYIIPIKHITLNVYYYLKFRFYSWLNTLLCYQLEEFFCLITFQYVKQ